jgi:RNA polymerase sigma-70 factor (ECF subfamily)
VSEARSFRDLIRRVRAGDEGAAGELVRRYEPAIRRAVRVRLDDARLRRLLDSTDVCQSVLASFFVRAALGQYELDRPAQLLRLLQTMAHNKVIDQARKHAAERHDHQHVALDESDEDGVRDGHSTPSEQVTHAELLGEFRRRLSDDERYLADQRAAGRGWDDLAAERGVGPEALRKQLARAVDRIARQLRLEL